jgi:uncharacterized membrane protein YukC
VNEQSEQELYELTRENNKMLHAMRRNAWLGGIVKIIFYILILVVAPLWIYSTYLAPLVSNMQQTINQAQGTNTKVQAQLTGFETMVKQVESWIPGVSQQKQ